MSNTIKINKSSGILLYKNDKKITIRKPKNVEDYTIFTSTSRDSLQPMKNFLKYVITDVRELNLLKNDLCFLINEIFERLGKDHATDISVDVESGVIFYVWVHLPYKWNTLQFPTPDSIREEIFPFDLFYVRQKMSNMEIKQIQDILKQQVDVTIHSRRPGEMAVSPFSTLKARLD